MRVCVRTRARSRVRACMRGFRWVGGRVCVGHSVCVRGYGWGLGSVCVCVYVCATVCVCVYVRARVCVMRECVIVGWRIDRV